MANTNILHKHSIHKVFKRIDKNNKLLYQYVVSGYIGIHLNFVQICKTIPVDIIRLSVCFIGELDSVANFAMNESHGTIIKNNMFPSKLCRLEKMFLWKEVLNNNTYDGIKKIIFRWCSLESKGVQLFCNGLQKACKHLKYLDLMGNEIGAVGVKAISNLLVANIDFDSFHALDAKYYKNKAECTIANIETLILSCNPIGNSINYIGKALSLTDKIKHLELENCEIVDNGMKFLRRGIERNESLQTLNIAANKFGNLGTREIQSFLLRNNSLINLNISRNRLGSDGTIEIAKGLTMNRSLKHLKMNLNRIKARGAQGLERMLTHNNSLEVLEISYNEIFNDGFVCLSQGLAVNHGLKKIVLWYNGLDDVAMREIARVLGLRSQQTFFRSNMVSCITCIMESIMLLNVTAICELIVDYLPIYMEFEIDVSFNKKITTNGIDALLKVANSETIAGIKTDLLLHSKTKRKIAAIAKTSFY